ncbi:hypothetical protein C8R47DRAFT_1281333 [Mycena vitilis]|nr:hypothetical protein C8R47DRAFT_1281333 [Mycena vitilis]
MPTTKKNGKDKSNKSKEKQAKSEPRRCNCSTTCGKLIAKRTRNMHYSKILDKSTILDSESEDDSETPSDIEMQAADGIREHADDQPMYTPSPEPPARQDADDDENSYSDSASVVGSDFELEEDSETEFGLEKEDDGQILREMEEMVLGSDDEDVMIGLDEQAELWDAMHTSRRVDERCGVWLSRRLSHGLQMQLVACRGDDSIHGVTGRHTRDQDASSNGGVGSSFRLTLCILHIATWIRPTGRRVLGPYRVHWGNTGSGEEGSAAPEPRLQAPAIYEHSRPDLRASDSDGGGLLGAITAHLVSYKQTLQQNELVPRLL